MKKIILLALLTFLLAGCGTEAEKIQEAYNLESADHVFELVDIDDVTDVVADKEWAMVYYGAPI